jgi:hypothetical protein
MLETSPMKRFVLPFLALALLVVGCGQPVKPKPVASTPPSPISVTVTGTGTGTGATQAAEPTHEEPGAPGTLAPELKGKKWITADGKAPDLKGKPYLVEFWSVT